MQAADEDVAAHASQNEILCTDQYGIYDDLDDRDGIDAHLAINHDDHFVLGDARVNHCENRHSSSETGWAAFEVSPNTISSSISTSSHCYATTSTGSTRSLASMSTHEPYSVGTAAAETLSAVGASL